MSELTKFEEILLLTIWKLKDEAYGVKIREYLLKNLHKEYSYGNLYSVLDQLVKKSYVNRHLGESTPERRGRPKVCYELTDEGKLALKNAKAINDVIWADIPDFFSSRIGK